jgi:hypothetical protein
MAGWLRDAFSPNAELINLHDIGIKGGCLGCLQCRYDNTCIYKDGAREFFDGKLAPADIIVVAGTMTDRYLSSLWKMFFDRSFYHGHTFPLAGKQIGFVIAGPLGQNPNLRDALTAWAEMQRANPVFVTDEVSFSARLDVLLREFAESLVRFSHAGYIRPPTFFRVGGMKIFRDAIYGGMRIAFKADYRFYKKHGLFDFPHGDIRTRLFNAVMIPLTKIPAVREKIFPKMKEYMVRPFEKVLKEK